MGGLSPTNRRTSTIWCTTDCFSHMWEALRGDYTNKDCCTNRYNIAAEGDLENMQVVHQRCCGLDITRRTIPHLLFIPNLKFDSEISDIPGASGRAMIEAIICDIEDPKLLAQLAKGKMKNKRKNLKQALLR